MSTPSQALRDAARVDAGRPRLTWYDQATGERIELSGTSLINWVDKTAHLLVGELGLSPGGSVAIDLPRHWLTAVWWLAVDAAGGRSRLGPDDAADIAVFGPPGLAALPPNGELVAVSLRPMGAGFDDPLPPPVHDYALAVRPQPDHFAGSDSGDRVVGARGEQLAASWGLAASDRVASAGAWRDADDLTASLLAPLRAKGSVVWIRNPGGRDLVPLLEAEGVTAWFDDPPSGLDLPPTIRSLSRTSVS